MAMPESAGQPCYAFQCQILGAAIIHTSAYQVTAAFSLCPANSPQCGDKQSTTSSPASLVGTQGGSPGGSQPVEQPGTGPVSGVAPGSAVVPGSTTTTGVSSDSAKGGLSGAVVGVIVVGALLLLGGLGAFLMHKRAQKRRAEATERLQYHLDRHPPQSPFSFASDRAAPPSPPPKAQVERVPEQSSQPAVPNKRAAAAPKPATFQSAAPFSLSDLEQRAPSSQSQHAARGVPEGTLVEPRVGEVSHLEELETVFVPPPINPEQFGLPPIALQNYSPQYGQQPIPAGYSHYPPPASLTSYPPAAYGDMQQQQYAQYYAEQHQQQQYAQFYAMQQSQQPPQHFQQQ
ncbi:hypothetical protein HDU98_004285 [Podochytrium sp. JEL0797]|nr:hypothetical protein HDU98_004285 [Podochytrium sp. JEL0797]